MRSFIYNIGHFFNETGRIIRTNVLSYVFTVISMVLILMISGIVAAGWLISANLAEKLKQEAEISVYAEGGADADEGAVQSLAEKLKDIEGVRDVRVVSEEEAYLRMEDVLGDEADILTLFEENPFRAFIEVRIDITRTGDIIAAAGNLEGVGYIRDNRELLDQIESLTEGLLLAGYLIVLAVGVAALISVSHMIRQGIYANREQISTLKLLGAPGMFVSAPYIITGLFVSLLGGGAAAGGLSLLTGRIYGYMDGSLPFIPLPPQAETVAFTVSVIIIEAFVLGLAGSIFGLKTTVDKNG